VKKVVLKSKMGMPGISGTQDWRDCIRLNWRFWENLAGIRKAKVGNVGIPGLVKLHGAHTLGLSNGGNPETFGLFTTVFTDFGEEGLVTARKKFVCPG